ITLITQDRLDSTAAPVLQNNAKISGNNLGAPLVDTGKITLTTGALGPVVVGTAGAVADPDQPVIVLALDQTSGLTYSANAAADGSFNLALRGNTGDPIYFSAKDSNLFPMQSAQVLLGPLPVANITPTATVLTSTMSNNDANFRMRRLSADGNLLAAASHPASTDSNKIAIFDVSTATPTWLQTITNGGGNVHDITLRNGVVYVASGGFFAYDLSANPATSVNAGNPCGSSWSVAVDGTYAFVGGDCGSGRIEVYDITNPKVPVRVHDQDTNSCCQSYTQLLPYGKYLIGTTPNSAAGRGHDIVVLDRHDINNITLVADIDIPSFTGFRAAIQGTMLYVSSTEGSLATVDLTNPAAPVIKSVFSVANAGRGIGAVDTTAFFTAATNGTFAVDASNPSTPVLGGSVTTGQEAWDVAIRGNLGIVAAEDRLLTFTVGMPPQVNAAHITMSFDGH
ncbi:MAG TPA: hypothetical protein VKJ07_24930, partial [Mycobacteriales bacterium]|nr:hypothetical protein [Mycobacteriales bacterium]